MNDRTYHGGGNHRSSRDRGRCGHRMIATASAVIAASIVSAVDIDIVVDVDIHVPIDIDVAIGIVVRVAVIVGIAIVVGAAVDICSGTASCSPTAAILWTSQDWSAGQCGNQSKTKKLSHGMVHDGLLFFFFGSRVSDSERDPVSVFRWVKGESCFVKGGSQVPGIDGGELRTRLVSQGRNDDLAGQRVIA